MAVHRGRERRDTRRSSGLRRRWPAAVAAVAAVAVGATVGWAQSAPPELAITTAAVSEVAPVLGAPQERVVALSITLPDAPPCPGAQTPLRYGFLVDADADPATGARLTGAPSLGVDAQITATCTGGAFASPFGPVSVEPRGDDVVLEITGRLADLPSLRFRWVAFAQHGDVWTTHPPSAPPGAFASLELQGR